MTIQEYMKSNSITIASLQRSTGIPYTTLCDVIKGKTDIDNANVGILVKISSTLELDLRTVYEMFKENTTLPQIPNGVLFLKKAKYYLQYNGAEYYLCKSNDINRLYLDYLAEVKINSIKREEALDSWS